MARKIDAETTREIDELLHDAIVAFGRTSGNSLVKVINEHDLTLPQIIALGFLEQGPQTVSGLSELLQLTPGAVSRLVERLVRKGLVNRREGDSDRRQKTLRITPAGKRLSGKLERARIGSFEATLSELDADLAASLKEVMKRVVVVLRAHATAIEGNKP